MSPHDGGDRPTSHALIIRDFSLEVSVFEGKPRGRKRSEIQFTDEMGSRQTSGPKTAFK